MRVKWLERGRRGLAVAGFGLLMLAGSAAEARTTRVLLTAFGKFGGEPDNASRAMVAAFERSLQKKPLPGGRIELRTETLPVVYGKAERLLEERYRQVEPDVAISFGQADEAGFRVEAVARNLDSTSYPDNDGVSRDGEKIVADGPDAYSSGLPIETMRDAIRAAGFEAFTSDDAGGYLCNHVFYSLMHLAATMLFPDDDVPVTTQKVTAGFVHVPSKPWGDEITYEAWGEKHVPAIRAIVLTALRAHRASEPLDGPNDFRPDLRRAPRYRGGWR